MYLTCALKWRIRQVIEIKAGWRFPVRSTMCFTSTSDQHFLRPWVENLSGFHNLGVTVGLELHWRLHNSFLVKSRPDCELYSALSTRSIVGIIEGPSLSKMDTFRSTVHILLLLSYLITDFKLQENFNERCKHRAFHVFHYSQIIIADKDRERSMARSFRQTVVENAPVQASPSMNMHVLFSLRKTDAAQTIICIICSFALCGLGTCLLPMLLMRSLFHSQTAVESFLSLHYFCSYVLDCCSHELFVCTLFSATVVLSYYLLCYFPCCSVLYTCCVFRTSWYWEKASVNK